MPNTFGRSINKLKYQSGYLYQGFISEFQSFLKGNIDNEDFS